MLYKLAVVIYLITQVNSEKPVGMEGTLQMVVVIQLTAV